MNAVMMVSGSAQARRARVGGVLWATLLCGLLAAPVAQAACMPTPPLATLNYPGYANIQNSNNLLQPAGKPLAAEGQRVMIRGRVLDSNCMPVPDVQVELWQVDPFGKWMLATGEDLVNPNPVFAGAGRAHTLNDGSFAFYTAFPAALPKRAPHFNLRVTVRDRKPFDTVLFFADDGRNASDPVYTKLKPEGRAAVSLQVNEGANGLMGDTTLVLPFKASYLQY